MEVVACIAARGGSKGIPQKNIRPLAGKPLIAWTIDAALASRRVNRVLVSTDDPHIAEVAQWLGAEAPFLRPTALARDDSPSIDTLLHLLMWLEDTSGVLPDYTVLLQPTSPFRTAEDIDAAVDLAVSREADAVVSVCPAQDHPYLVKTLDGGGRIASLVQSNHPPRQAFPQAYVLNGAVYVNRTKALLQERVIVPEGALAYVMPEERSLDIDTPWQLQLADLLMRETQHRRAA